MLFLCYATLRSRKKLYAFILHKVRRATKGGIRSICPPPKLSKHCIVILAFAETFKKEDEIVYSDKFLKKPYLNFSLSYWLIISLQDLSWEGHLIKNFVTGWYLTTNTLELSKLEGLLKMLGFLRHFFLLFVCHSESFQKLSVCVRFHYISCLSSED